MIGLKRDREGVWMKKFVFRILVCAAAFAFLLRTGGCLAKDGTGNPLKLAGNYICFEERGGTVSAVLKQGIITVSDGRITGIAPIGEEQDDVLRMDDECVMFPGLIDLHSHVEFNSVQMWAGGENEVPWDNRFEWRRAAKYRADIGDRQAVLWSRWAEPFGKGSFAVGDLIEYFVEAQAAAGGTTLIQGYNQTDAYDTADSHEKVDFIRGTCFPRDLGVAEGREVQCLIQVFKPDVEIDPAVPKSYLPPIDTSVWKETLQMSADEKNDHLSMILDSIKNKTSGGWLIHMAEGRAGKLIPGADPYSRLEFLRFREAILSGIKNGDFTTEDVRNAHIVLIHACGVDLTNREDYAFIRNCGIGLVWSPVSNLLLYGDTPAFYNYLGDDALCIGLGSDWSPSGSKTVWDECKFASEFMRRHADEASNVAEKLLKACTWNAARMIDNADLGNIAVGGFADLFILKGGKTVNGSRETALNTFTETGDSGVEAVIVGGRIVYADRDFLKSVKGEQLSSYGMFETEAPALKDKYFLVPPLFEGYSFDELYRAYTEIIKEAKLEFSLLRSSEDAVYTRVMNELKEKYCR